MSTLGRILLTHKIAQILKVRNAAIQEQANISKIELVEDEEGNLWYVQNYNTQDSERAWEVYRRFHKGKQPKLETVLAAKKPQLSDDDRKLIEQTIQGRYGRDVNLAQAKRIKEIAGVDLSPQKIIRIYNEEGYLRQAGFARISRKKNNEGVEIDKKLTLKNLVRFHLFDANNVSVFQTKNNKPLIFLMGLHSGAYKAWEAARLIGKLTSPAILIRQDEHDDLDLEFIRPQPETIEQAQRCEYSNIGFTVPAIYYGLIDEVYLIKNSYYKDTPHNYEAVLYEAKLKIGQEKIVAITLSDDPDSELRALGNIYDSITELKRINVHVVTDPSQMPDLSKERKPVLWDVDTDFYLGGDYQSIEGVAERLKVSQAYLNKINRVPDVFTFALSPETTGIKTLQHNEWSNRQIEVLGGWVDILNNSGANLVLTSAGSPILVTMDMIQALQIYEIISAKHSDARPEHIKLFAETIVGQDLAPKQILEAWNKWYKKFDKKNKGGFVDLGNRQDDQSEHRDEAKPAIPPSGITKVFLNGKEKEASAKDVRGEILKISSSNYIFNVNIYEDGKLEFGTGLRRKTNHNKIDYWPCMIRSLITDKKEIAFQIIGDTILMSKDHTEPDPEWAPFMRSLTQEKKNNLYIILARFLIEHDFPKSYRLHKDLLSFMRHIEFKIRPQTLGELAMQPLSSEAASQAGFDDPRWSVAKEIEFREIKAGSLTNEIINAIDKLEENIPPGQRIPKVVRIRFFENPESIIFIAKDRNKDEVVGYIFGVPQIIVPDTSLFSRKRVSVKETFYEMSWQVLPSEQHKGIGTGLRGNFRDAVRNAGYSYIATYQNDVYDEDELRAELLERYGQGDELFKLVRQLPSPQGSKIPLQYVVIRLSKPERETKAGSKADSPIVPGENIPAGPAFSPLNNPLGGIDLRDININNNE